MSMQWFNEPPQWKNDGEDRTITVTTAPQTDFWRVTHYGFVRHNGHFYHQMVEGDFIATVKVSGHYQDLYDQAGLMLRLDDFNWLKCGIEFVDGVQQISAVVTRDYSDWSVAPLSQNPASIWLQLKREGAAIEIKYSLDAVNYSLLRLTYLTLVSPIEVGLMCASPDGTGFEVVFEDFTVQHME